MPPYQYPGLREAYEASHIKENCKYRFAYPIEFTSLEDYSNHRNAIVLVTGRDYESDPVCDDDKITDIMFKVMAEDGWIGSAWESELEAINESEV